MYSGDETYGDEITSGLTAEDQQSARPKFRKGDLVRWRNGSYRVERVYMSEVRIENVLYPGAFHLVSPGQLEKVGCSK